MRTKSETHRSAHFCLWIDVEGGRHDPFNHVFPHHLEYPVVQEDEAGIRGPEQVGVPLENTRFGRQGIPMEMR